ncbi:MAG: Alanyl-tRNA editing protein AlaX-M [Candidatus Heimdallarchaeota archaeon LC_3]|nr:MAG: Alanyl-tRNA editing protein AlaX-M [Candidatus Heimdallarchaeota archaeon LC_3]
MTDLLYSEDSYLSNFLAKITSIEDDGAIILDKTVFYPGGGGQPKDKGVLTFKGKNYSVTNVKKQNDSILHYIDDKLPDINVGDVVEGEIDIELRKKHNRTHTAMHILCGVIYNEFGSTVTGGDFKSLSGRMDFDIDNFSKDRIQFIEKKCNEAVKAKHDIKIEFLSREEAEKVPELIRTKINLIPKFVKVIRTVDIVGLDKQADGGTHVRQTGEVGVIKLVKVDNKGKGRRRIYLEIHD